MGGGRGHGRGSRWRQRRRDREVHGESELVPGARKAPGAGARASRPKCGVGALRGRQPQAPAGKAQRRAAPGIWCSLAGRSRPFAGSGQPRRSLGLGKKSWGLPLPRKLTPQLSREPPYPCAQMGKLRTVRKAACPRPHSKLVKISSHWCVCF